jgi:hypothetical protein
MDETLLSIEEICALIGVTKYRIKLADIRRVIHAKCLRRYDKCGRLLSGPYERKFLKSEVLEHAEEIRCLRVSKELMFAIDIFKKSACFLGAGDDMINRWLDEIKQAETKPANVKPEAGTV